ncbi:RNA methyltransferase [Maricaulis maris]|jgi:tRNA G18 (ribose-2'-O)-methylase SpoU|uniref:tRNA/rRNA methyltransferase (SpoU) n=1 Tax=Maricaulis maris (strain MCS10) TaxID=394221 RepID=Q0ATR5_MARMM|nr:RNA methyltransferase [Maricaulis maris]ABI64322.1 tRNA/rRNA methyltransferase (SpoU) [Maricaulis maris MCS10]
MLAMKRGYFGVGAEGISKPMNMGAILRTAHAFGASFAFTLNASHQVRDVYRADTAKSADHVPYYEWPDLSAMALPSNCQLVGIELAEDAVDLPSFRHPLCAAYVFGRERGSLSQEVQDRCSHIVKIPTKFCVNVSVACAITLYDRQINFGGFPERPLMPGGPDLESLAETTRKAGIHR